MAIVQTICLNASCHNIVRFDTINRSWGSGTVWSIWPEHMYKLSLGNQIKPKHYHVRACMPMVWNTTIYVRGWWQKLSSYVRKADSSRLAETLLCVNDGTTIPTAVTIQRILLLMLLLFIYGAVTRGHLPMLKPSSRMSWENVGSGLGECWKCSQNNSLTAFGDLGRSWDQMAVQKTLQRVWSGFLGVVDAVTILTAKSLWMAFTRLVRCWPWLRQNSSWPPLKKPMLTTV